LKQNRKIFCKSGHLELWVIYLTTGIIKIFRRYFITF